MPTVLANGKGGTFSYDILNLVFNAQTITGIAQNVTSGALTSLYVTLHTAMITDLDAASVSECAYTGYARVGVTRNSSNWYVASVVNTVSPVNPIVFGTCTAGTETAVAFSITTASSGATKVLYRGYINPAISISSGVAPTLGVGTILGED